MKFRTKLLMVYMVAAIGFTIILAGFFFHYGENKVRRSLYEQLFVQTQLVAEEFSRLPNLAPGPEVAALVRKAARVSRSRVTVIAADGGVIADSAYDYQRMPNHGDRPEIAAALRGEAYYSSHYSRTLKQNLLYVAAPLLRLGRIGGAVRLAKSQAELDQALLHLRWIILGGVLLTLFFPLALASVILTRMTRPVLELQRLARRIGQGDLTVRVRFFGNDELAELGLMFNGMVKQLDESFRTIRDEKRKLEVILENLNDGILVIDRELKIMLANRAAQRVLGLASREIQGRQVLEAVLNHHLLALIQEVNRSKTTLESELTLHFPRNGQLQVFLAPLADQAGSSLGSIVVLHDLTRIRQLERVRQDFVANVSHELRTPITSIKAMTETLLGGAWRDNAVFMRYLEAINSESDRLTNLINDLLALARLDAKQVTSKEAVDLVELIGEVRERFGPVKGRTPFFEFVEPDHPLPKVEANRDQIRQVLINLLDNAFKYTPADGQVRISCWQEADQLKVAVADTGIGIPREDQARIFERFYRVDKARSREIGGTGLGLAIVKHIIEAHGGRITVESAPNRGSVFSFTLPVA